MIALSGDHLLVAYHINIHHQLPQMSLN